MLKLSSLWHTLTHYYAVHLQQSLRWSWPQLSQVPDISEVTSSVGSKHSTKGSPESLLAPEHQGFLHESPDVDPAVLCLASGVHSWNCGGLTPRGVSFGQWEVVNAFLFLSSKMEDAETEFI